MTCWGGKYLARRNGNWWERSVAIGKTVRETSQRPAVLLRRGRVLEGITLGWNVAGIVVLAVSRCEDSARLRCVLLHPATRRVDGGRAARPRRPARVLAGVGPRAWP